MSEPKFKKGQIVVATIGKKEIPFRVLQVIEKDGEFYYRWNRSNAAAEHMVRAQTESERGSGRVENGL